MSMRERPLAAYAAAFLLLFSMALPARAVAPQSQDEAAPEPAAPPAPDYAWAPSLLYDFISAPNQDALDALYDAAFAAGPPAVPDLIKALADDRTAEFAAQSLAFIGGEQAITALSKLVNDPRDLDLRQFYYGALGEFDTAGANQVLLNVIRNANREPDRTVTEAAIVALTVRSDPGLVPQLRQAEAQLTDVVIQDDLENALSIISSRARDMAAAGGKSESGSLQQAVRTYFLPALRPEPGGTASHPARGRRTAVQPPAMPGGEVHVEHVEFSPNKSRALARVIFQNPVAVAHYTIVLQKQYGNWTVASVWLGAEEDRPGASS